MNVIQYVYFLNINKKKVIDSDKHCYTLCRYDVHIIIYIKFKQNHTSNLF